MFILITIFLVVVLYQNVMTEKRLWALEKRMSFFKSNRSS